MISDFKHRSFLSLHLLRVYQVSLCPKYTDTKSVSAQTQSNRGDRKAARAVQSDKCCETRMCIVSERKRDRNIQEDDTGKLALTDTGVS